MGLARIWGPGEAQKPVPPPRNDLTFALLTAMVFAAVEDLRVCWLAKRKSLTWLCPSSW